jgi:hypothetical protein
MDAAGPTFSKDVAPILYAHCSMCHHPDDIAPMSLLTYEEVRPWAVAIREAVLSRKMPPWHADSRFGHFSNDARLSESEIGVLDAWSKNGATQGDPRDLPPLPHFEGGWHIKPDYVATIPEANLAESKDSDKYVDVYVATPFKEDKWIQAAEVLPGNRKIVHHATVWIPTNKLGGESKPDDRSGDKYRYISGDVLHIRPEVPVENDGCSVPGGGALPGEAGRHSCPRNLPSRPYAGGAVQRLRPEAAGRFRARISDSLSQSDRQDIARPY